MGVLAILGCIAMVWGTWYAAQANASGLRFTLFDFAYGPAVIKACGGEYVSPQPGAVPALDAFLATRIDRFDCAALPAHIPEIELTGFQRTFRYLMWAVALVWAVAGVSWSALSYLSGVLLAATVVTSVLLFRLVAPLPIAACAGALAMVSPLHLTYLSDFRNYPKAPLSIGVAVALGALLKSSTARQAAMASAAFGVLLGVGLGFRQDLLIFLPLFVAAVAVLKVDGGHVMRAKLAAGAIGIVCTLAAAAPQLTSYVSAGGGASVTHVATLGLMSTFDEPLGVTNDGLYEWGYYNEDSFASAIISGHGRRVLSMTGAMPVYGQDYDRAGWNYWQALFKTFPADLLIRAYASLIKLIELPSSTANTQVPSIVAGSAVQYFWQLRAAVLEAMFGAWTIVSVVALLIVGARRPLLAIAVAAAGAYLLAFPALQFQERHYFYLGVVPMLAAVFVLSRGLRMRRFTPARADFVRMAACAAALVMLFAAPVMAARIQQRTAVTALLNGYDVAPTRPLSVAESADGERTVLQRVADDAPWPAPGTTETELLVIPLGGADCHHLTVPVTIRYRLSHSTPNFTRTIEVALPLPPARARMFAPVFAHQSQPPAGELPVSYRFDAVSVPSEARACVGSIAKVAMLDSFPLLVGAYLTDDWRQQQPFQTLVTYESRTRVTPAIAVDPAALAASPRLLGAVEPWPLVARHPAAVEQADVVAIEQDGRWRVDGRGGLGGRGRMFYLARLQGVELPAGAIVIATGRLHRGGLSLGLQRDGSWLRQVAFNREGPFLAAVEVPEAGRYDVVIANNLPGRFASNRFDVSAIGLLK